MVKNENWGTRSWRKFRRERTREKFRRLKFQPVLPSSHNRDLRKLPRGRWREVRSKENRESSTAKRDFHPFYLLFPPPPFLFFPFLFFFSSLHPLRDEIESPFRTHHRSRLRHPFSTTGEKEEEEEEGKENCKYRDQTRNGNEGGVGKLRGGIREEKGKMKTWKAAASWKRFLTICTCSSPLLIFPPVEISPVEILRNNRGGRGIFFTVEREEKKWKRWGRGRNSEAGKV